MPTSAIGLAKCPPKIVDAKVSYTDRSAGSFRRFRRHMSVDRLRPAPPEHDEPEPKVNAMTRVKGSRSKQRRMRWSKSSRQWPDLRLSKWNPSGTPGQT